MIKPVEIPLTLYQGATFDKRFTWKAGGDPVDLTGCQVRAQVRRHLRATETLLDMTLDNDQAKLHDPAAGRFGLYLDATTTAELAFSSGVYDLEVEFPDGTVVRLLSGDVTLDREVTR
ncbi:MAG: hypothetical protein ACOCTI_03690 [Phycisphaeraceae bacterium]